MERSLKMGRTPGSVSRLSTLSSYSDYVAAYLEYVTKSFDAPNAPKMRHKTLSAFKMSAQSPFVGREAAFLSAQAYQTKE